LLYAPFDLVSQCRLEAADASSSFLARVCDLHITSIVDDVDPLDPTDVARVLRAAPQLKRFYTSHPVQSDGSWLAPTAPTHPQFEGLVHPRLRELGVARVRPAARRTSERTPPDAEWVAHLRRCHFPRLRELIVGDDTYFERVERLPREEAVLYEAKAVEIGEAVFHR
jgi:hypothetical protein